MGFSIHFRSTRPVAPDEAAAVRKAASRANRGHTWLGCEPVVLRHDEDGRLSGSSKPNFLPHPDDAASAAGTGLPNGDVRTLLDVLCRLSREHGLDWEVRHDHEPGPVGYIRGGECDPALTDRAEALDGLADVLAEIEEEAARGPEGDDGEGPTTLPFLPRH